MPTRMIRGDLLESERYWGVSDEAKVMFVHLMLIADDFGCCTGAPIALRRLTTDGTKSVDRISKLVQELADADLLRPYAVDKSPFLFVPRFRQRLRLMKLKHPPPPFELLQDDLELCEKIKEIMKESKNLSDKRRQMPVKRGHLPSNEGLKVEGLKVEERSLNSEGLKVEGIAPVDNSEENPFWYKTDKGIETEARRLNVNARPGEGYKELKARVWETKAKGLRGEAV